MAFSVSTRPGTYSRDALSPGLRPEVGATLPAFSSLRSFTALVSAGTRWAALCPLQLAVWSATDNRDTHKESPGALSAEYKGSHTRRGGRRAGRKSFREKTL